MNQLPDWLRRAFSATQPPALAPYCVGEYRRHTFRGAAACARCGRPNRRAAGAVKDD